MKFFARNNLSKTQYEQAQNQSNARMEINPKVCSIICYIIFASTLWTFILWTYNMHTEITDTYVVYFDKLQSLSHITSDKFLSFGLDTSLLRNMNEMPLKHEKFIILSRHLSPAYVRIGGTSSDCLIFNQEMKQSYSKKMFSPVDGQDISNFTISDMNLIDLYKYTTKSKLRMIFDLNVLLRNLDRSWNDTNAQEIITFAKNHNMDLDWQLGNEPNSFKHVFNISISATELAKDYDHLRQLLDKVGYTKSILIGPEVNHIDDTHRGEEYAKLFLESQKYTVNYVSWHQYYLNGREAKVQDFVNPATFNYLPQQIQMMNNIITASRKYVSMWLSETSTAFGGGAPELSDRFVAGFLWLDKLGYSASAGLNVVTRQSLYGGNYAMISPDLTPNPDWWVSVIYKQFVSEKVLKLKMLNNYGYIRLYMHCTPQENLIDGMPATTIYGVNIDKVAAQVNITTLTILPSDTTVKIFLYSLTADHLQSSEIKMNDEVLKLQPNGDLPSFRPRILEPTDPIILPPYSMVFLIIHDIKIPACLS